MTTIFTEKGKCTKKQNLVRINSKRALMQSRALEEQVAFKGRNMRAKGGKVCFRYCGMLVRFPRF